MKTRFNLNFNPSYGTFELRIIQEDERTNRIWSGELNFKEVEFDGDFIEPTLRVDRKEVIAHGNPLEELMNELWNAGIRPKDVGSPGELSATKDHLKDMQKLVFEIYNK